MNNTAELKVKGKKYPLLFGRAAVEEVSRRLGLSFTANDFKNTLDLVYAGMLNWAIKHDLPSPVYSMVYDIVEAFHDEEDALEQFSRINQVFMESRFGKEFAQKIEDLKKKAELETERLLTGRE